MKNLLLFTSEKVGDTGTVSYNYIFQHDDGNAFDKYPKQCSGAFGLLKQTDEEDTLYMNIFRGGQGVVLACPISREDEERNAKLIEESFPDNFNMLCTTDVANKLKEYIGSKVNIDVLVSDKTLTTS